MIGAGTITFFFSDIEDSTRLWEAHPQGMRAALARHDAILRDIIKSSDGTIVKTTGDGIYAAFRAPSGALAAAALAQKAMEAEGWPAIAPDAIKIRIGVHTGEAEERDNDYFGPAVNRAARIMAIGHGGQVLLSGVTAELVDGADAVSDLGEVRLRGFTRAEHVYQLMGDGLAVDFPPLRTEAVNAGNLPQQLTSFVGRAREKEDVTGLLSETRLLTLTGPGGTGKTRLSLEVAGDLQDHYAHGVWLVELAAISDSVAVPAAVAELWGLRENPMVPLERILADYVRGKEMLLILDNCEHLVAESAQLASTLLTAAPRLTILASSREGLGVPGETTYHLPTLRIPEREMVDADALRELDSVQLFIDRANAVQPGFRLTPQNAPAVGRIVRRLDGIPLAIELAAARLKLLPPEQLAERIDDRFRLLTGGSRTALPRQQTLRALIDWSYDYLDPAEQALFCQLGVFAGGWTLEAAETVVDLSNLETGFLSGELAAENQSQKNQFLDAMDLLANLVNKSLVVMEEEDGRARFRFLETIRQYARDRLFESGEGVAARDRHLDYFADLVLEGKPLGEDATHLSLFSAVGSPEMIAWAERTQTETDNIRAAVQWALQSDPERALAMATKLPLLFIFAGPAIEARQWLADALQAVEDLEPATGETARLREILLLQGRLWQGNLQLGEGRIPEARETLQAAAARSWQLDLPRLLAMALSLQSLALTFMNDPAAYEMAAESLAIMEDLGEESLQAMPLGNMIMSKIQQGDLDAAQDLKQRARTVMKRGSNVFMNALQIVTLARTATLSGDLDEAEELLKLASEQFEKLGSRNFLIMVESEIGHLQRRKGNYATAEALYRRTIREWQDFGHQAAVANQLETLGFIATHQGHLQRAASLLGAAEAQRDYLGVDMLPDERVAYEAEVATLREAMAVDALAEAWQAGRGLDMDAAVDLAVSGEWMDDE